MEIEKADLRMRKALRVLLLARDDFLRDHTQWVEPYSSFFCYNFLGD